MIDYTRGYSLHDFMRTSGQHFRDVDRVKVWAHPGALLRAYHALGGPEFRYDTAPHGAIKRCRTMLRQQAGRLQEHVRR